MPVERRGPAVCNGSNNKGGKGEMTKAPISLQDLRRSLYIKAKAEASWRFWGLYVHVCKMETLREAYRMARSNDGAPGIDGVTFEAIEQSGVVSFLEQIRAELVTNTYRPMRVRKKEIPKDGGKVRILSIPAIRDRVVQGALKLILEPIFEADFQGGSYGYRPNRTAHAAVARVAQAIVEEKTRIIDLDLKAYFDNVQHYLLLAKVARRVQDEAVMHLLKMILKATGKKGVPQGGIVSPMLSNLYLNEVDRMLEKAVETTRRRKSTCVQYARFADDLVILIDAERQSDWLVKAVNRRLREELAKLRVVVNEDKSRMVDLKQGDSFTFLGFEYRRILSLKRKWRPYYAPKLKKRTALFEKLREVFRQHVSWPVKKVIEKINPILRGWVNYFRVGHASRCFAMVKRWVEKKVRRHLVRAREGKGHGWTRWSSEWLYERLGLFNEYRLYRWSGTKAVPARYVT
jgi:RNA-directed DNA polymerase